MKKIESCVLGLAIIAAAPAAFAGTNVVAMKASNGKYVSARNDGTVKADRDSVGDPEKFVLMDLNGGALKDGDMVVLRAHSGKFVVAENGGDAEVKANRAEAAAWERFKIARKGGTGEIANNGQFFLKSDKGRWVKTTATKDVRADSAAAGPAETFTLEVQGNPADVKLSAPFADPKDFSAPIGVDHDSMKRGSKDTTPATCKNYAGKDDFPHCYNDHEGTDFMLKSWFPGMDLKKNPVLAAAPGVVIDVADGNADHCFAMLQVKDKQLADQQIFCPKNPQKKANFVDVLQADGRVARYFHLQKDSLTVKKHDYVQCGSVLGSVGSSGISSSPHLHFGMIESGADVDPYKKGLWSELDSRKVPKLKCTMIPRAPITPPPATVAQQTCSVVKEALKCDNEPAKTICGGLDKAFGSKCVVKRPNGTCAKACSDLCNVVQETISGPCP